MKYSIIGLLFLAGTAQAQPPQERIEKYQTEILKVITQRLDDHEKVLDRLAGKLPPTPTYTPPAYIPPVDPALRPLTAAEQAMLDKALGNLDADLSKMAKPVPPPVYVPPVVYQPYVVMVNDRISIDLGKKQPAATPLVSSADDGLSINLGKKR